VPGETPLVEAERQRQDRDERGGRGDESRSIRPRRDAAFGDAGPAQVLRGPPVGRIVSQVGDALPLIC